MNHPGKEQKQNDMEKKEQVQEKKVKLISDSASEFKSNGISFVEQVALNMRDEHHSGPHRYGKKTCDEHFEKVCDALAKQADFEQNSEGTEFSSLIEID